MLEGEAQTEDFGARLAKSSFEGATVYLHGDLGMGKTTLCRGALLALGHSGRVKSPTYTLVEPYTLGELQVYHFDLYRLGDPEELEYMGIRDYFSAGALCLVEWPEKGSGVLPEPDLRVELRTAEYVREVRWKACSPRGEAICAALLNH
ncbi:MAG: tRNA (adenosine(37)-N6)-threonylcarbamoyltransferase complex ATPase subunit type 1 TsaE [Pseudomonadales bacterium]|nr:tRNA (adenosine(37)-N6)-threonylcarbamoyltransferase complex ATPase subunit type 1 TsaE [Pseudomonadales bacterium]